MTSPLRLTIPRCPTRDEIESGVREVLVRGVGAKADVVAVEVGGRSMVVKDFKPRGRWARRLGRVQIRREAAAYEWLAGVPGVPAFVGRIDDLALAIERIDGQRLAFAALSETDGRRCLAQLRSILDAIHARGVVHNDLRGRENVLLRRDGGLAVIDFAGALRLRPGGWAHRVLFARLAATDEAAFLKWKGMIVPGSYTSEDEAFLRRYERWRRLWPFNPKRRKARPKAA